MSYMKLMEKINHIVSIAGAMFLAIITLVTFAQVIARYIFQSAMDWPELAMFLFVWLAYLGCCKNMHENSHLRVEALVMLFSKRVQLIINIITLIITVCFSLFIAYNGALMAVQVSESGQEAMTMPIPLALVWSVIPVCFTITALQAIMLVIKRIEDLKHCE